MSAATLLTDLDAVSTAFEVVPLDQTPTRVTTQSQVPNTRSCDISLLPQAQIPSLVKTITLTARDWLPASTGPRSTSHFVYLDRVDCVCYADGAKAKIWRASRHADPVEYSFDESITCLGTVSHERVDQILLICTEKKVSHH